MLKTVFVLLGSFLEEQWWISGIRYGSCSNWFVEVSFHLINQVFLLILFWQNFYFIRRKSSGCPESRFSPAVCSTAERTWSVATAPRHIMASLKYEQIWKRKHNFRFKSSRGIPTETAHKTVMVGSDHGSYANLLY